MRWQVFVICAGGLLLSAGLPLVRADDNTLQSQYLKIYLKINDADQLERQGNYAGALADFKDCYARLQKIHNTDPNWESALVIHRMNDCRAKIGELADRAAMQEGTQVAPNDNNGGPAPTAADLPDDVPTLKKRLTEVEANLQDTQARLADTQAKLQNSQYEATTLRTQLDSVNQQLTAMRGNQSEDTQVGKLLSQNKALQDKLASAQKEIASIKSPNPKSALSLVRAQLKNTQDKLDASEAANTALQQTTDTLRSQLEAAQNDLTDANRRLAAAPTNSPDYDTLKRENEVMREILGRELQEQAHRDMAKRLAQEEFDNLKIKSKVLQEQIDILGSPMTPPTSDQERALLDSLKVASAQVAPVPSENGNGFSASNVPSTNAPSATPANTNVATNPASPESSPMVPPPTSATNTDTASSTNAAPTTNAPPPAETAMAPATNTPDTSSTNQTAMTTPPSTPTTVTPATPPSDTNSVAAAPTPSDTNMVSTPTPPATPPTPPPDNSTNSVASTPSTNAPTPDNGASTNAAPSTASTTNNAPTPSGPPTQTQLPPAQTVVQDTTIHQGGDTNTTTPAEEYSSKPRLPDDMRDTAQQAADLFKMQRYDDAADKYQSIIDKYPESLYAWSNLGVVRFQQGKLPEALKALQQAVKLSPTDAFSYSNLGIVYYQLNQYENAISALERALALDPNNAKSHNYLGCACSQKGWTEVAEKEFLKAIEIDDQFADAHFNLSLVYATEKPPSLEMARRHYKRALELGIPPDPRLEKLLGMNGDNTQYPQAAAQK